MKNNGTPYRRSKWFEYKDALALMQAGDPPLTWDVISMKTAREYATRISRDKPFRFSIEYVGTHPDGKTRIQITRVEKAPAFA